MIVDFRTLFYFTAVSLLIYWLVPSRFMEMRRAVLVFFSLLFLGTISIPASLILLTVALYVFWMSSKFQGKLSEKHRYIVAIGVFIPLVLLEFIDGSLPPNAPAEAAPLIGLGLAFYSLRAYSVLMDSLNGRVNPSAKDIIFLLCAFPSFGAGPIEKVNAYLTPNIQTALKGPDMAFAVYRIAVSVFKVEVILKVFLQTYREDKFGSWGSIPWDTLGFAHAWLCVMISFLIVYVNFSAYTDMAIGISRLFGIKLRENFDFPLVSTNVQKFWRRWHMSLGNWLVEYIYTPLVRNTGRPYLAIFLSFFMIGIWHNVTMNYMVWGAAHGLALAWINWSTRKVRKMPRVQFVQSLIGYKVLMWFITMNFVAIISTFAMERSVANGLSMLKSLVL